jgi:hypothetical protein
MLHLSSKYNVLLKIAAICVWAEMTLARDLPGSRYISSYSYASSREEGVYF